MKTSSKFSLVAFFVSSSVSSMATPIAIGPAIIGPGDGINSAWVQVDAAHKPDTIAEALAVLAMNSGDSGFIASSQMSGTAINFSDSAWHQANWGSLPPPFPGIDPIFAVRFSGYFNATMAGNYSFAFGTDDGFRMTLGGEVIASYNQNRAYAYTYVSNVNLQPGLYPVEFVGWEQGGGYSDIQWTWNYPVSGVDPISGNGWQITPSTAFFTAVPDANHDLPDVGSTLTLLGGGLVALAGLRRKLLKA